MTILEAMDDPTLFGSAFPDRATWKAWRIFLRGLFALPLEAEDRELYAQHTGRAGIAFWPLPREGWVVVGRRGGKSRIAALVAVFLACFRDYADVLSPGERGTLPVIAADRRQARVVFKYIVGLIEGSPVLASLIESRTAEAIHLTNGVTIEVHTASWRSTRGYTLVGAVLDEVAFWRTDDSANPDTEIIAALRPGMATVPGALLLAISSPYARRGSLWTAYKRHYAKDGDPIFVWKAGTRDMNPTVPEDVVTDALAADEAAAQAEYLGEFRRDIEAFVSREALEACVIPDRHELPPVAGVAYRAFVDPSGGSQDSFALAIAHGEQRGDQMIAVLDYLAERRPPFNPQEIVEQYAAVLKAYGIGRVQSDKYAGQWVVEAFARHGILCEQSALPKSDLYANLLPLLNSGRVGLLDHPRLQAQLLGLERRTSRAGRDAIDHGPGGHDDVANVVAGCCLLAAESATIGDPGFIGGERRQTVPSTAAGFDSYEREAWEHEVGLVGGRKSWRDSDPW